MTARDISLTQDRNYRTEKRSNYQYRNNVRDSTTEPEKINENEREWAPESLIIFFEILCFWRMRWCLKKHYILERGVWRGCCCSPLCGGSVGCSLGGSPHPPARLAWSPPLIAMPLQRCRCNRPLPSLTFGRSNSPPASGCRLATPSLPCSSWRISHHAWVASDGEWGDGCGARKATRISYAGAQVRTLYLPSIFALRFVQLKCSPT